MFDEAQAVQMSPPARWAPERLRVDDWRLGELLRAGYSLTDANRIALRSDIDLHQAVNLVAGGCPAETAAQILL